MRHQGQGRSLDTLRSGTFCGELSYDEAVCSVWGEAGVTSKYFDI